MNKKTVSDIRSSDLPAEDLKKILSTIKRVPDRRAPFNRTEAPTRNSSTGKISVRKRHRKLRPILLVGMPILLVASVIVILLYKVKINRDTENNTNNGITLENESNVDIGNSTSNQDGLKSELLIGTWNYDDVTIYTFDGEGCGALVLPLGNYEFTYVVAEGNLSLDFDDESAMDRSYMYTVSDGELILTGSDGMVYRLVRIDS